MRVLILSILLLFSHVSCTNKETTNKITDQVEISGGIKQPGLYTYEQGLTAMNAIILAGGFTEKADPEIAEIVRTSLEGTTERLTINLKNVLRGKTDDLPLTPGDKLIIPE